jgi:hypothetical protein
MSSFLKAIRWQFTELSQLAFTSEGLRQSKNAAYRHLAFTCMNLKEELKESAAEYENLATECQATRYGF